MTLNEIILHIKDICLRHNQINSFQAGMRYNAAQNKGENYPLVWLETPALIDYTNRTQKRFTMALNVLILANNDDYVDVVNKQSQTEEIMDDILQALQFFFKNNMAYENISGITIENFSDDLAVGCRSDFTIITNRNCDSKENFN